MKKIRQILCEKGPFIYLLFFFFFRYAIKSTILTDSFETCTDGLYYCKNQAYST